MKTSACLLLMLSCGFTYGLWADTYTDIGPLTLYGEYGNGSESEMVICTQFKHAEFMFRFSYAQKQSDGTQTMKHDNELYIPSDAYILVNESTCLNITGGVSKTITEGRNKGDETLQYSSQTTIAFGNDSGKFTLYFSNITDAPYNVPGWYQFALWSLKLELYMTHPNMSKHFPNSFDDVLIFNGTSDNADEKTSHGRWWKLFGTYSESTFSCATNLAIDVIPEEFSFYFQNMELSALNLGDHGFTNDTYPNNVCNYDYEKNDKIAVWIGSVQTGFTLFFLVAYFIYLRKRGPVEVPRWIVEPALRNAEVKPIDDYEYERRMSTMKPTDDVNGVLTKRLNSKADSYYVPDERF